jgi:hypothetical protein
LIIKERVLLGLYRARLASESYVRKNINQSPKTALDFLEALYISHHAKFLTQLRITSEELNSIRSLMGTGELVDPVCKWWYVKEAYLKKKLNN